MKVGGNHKKQRLKQNMPSNQKDDPAPITTLESKVVYENPWITIREDSIQHPNGRQGIYGFLDSGDSVMVVATNAANEIYMVRAYRYPSKGWGWELPGGGADREDPITASQRELLEETGFTSESWTLLGNPLVCNGLMTERMAITHAANVSANTALVDEEELFADKRFFSLQEIRTMITNGEIDDSQTITGLFLYINSIKE